MFRLFDEVLDKSNDHHHVFLEGIERVGTKTIGGKKVAVYRALAGS